jgi:hypothetical protein
MLPSKAANGKNAAMLMLIKDAVVQYLPAALQVRAVSCQDLVPSAVAVKQVQVAASPPIVVSMTLDGRLSASQLYSGSGGVVQKLESAVAESLGVKASIVQLLTFKESGQRRAGLALAFQVLTTNNANATALIRKVKVTDFSAAILRKTGIYVDVADIGATIQLDGVTSTIPTTQPSVQDTPVSTGGMSTSVIAGIAGGGGGGILVAFLLVLAVYRHKHKKTADVALQERSAASGQLAWCPVGDSGATVGLATAPAVGLATAPAVGLATAPAESPQWISL